MNRLFAILVCILTLPGTALAATKSYNLAPFEGVAVSAGIAADIKIGSPQSVVAETHGTNFEDLAISVEGKVLRIGRPPGNWLFWRHPGYRVHIVVPALHSLAASSGASIKVDGSAEGDFMIAASSSGKVQLPALKGAYVSARASSGGAISVGGSCASLYASASSGADVDASALQCESIVVQASSGGDVSAFASKSVMGNASSGGDIRVGGKPPGVQISESSGGRVTIAK
jgi:hypothetical protein